MLKPNNAVIPEPSFLNKEISELCKLLMYFGIFLSLTNNFLILFGVVFPNFWPLGPGIH